jgi:hypothetical protein
VVILRRAQAYSESSHGLAPQIPKLGSFVEGASEPKELREGLRKTEGKIY